MYGVVFPHYGPTLLDIPSFRFVPLAVIARSPVKATWQSPEDFGDNLALGSLALRG